MKTADAILLSALLAPALLGCESPVEPEQAPELAEPIVHTYSASEAGIFANAYLVETENGVVAVDATLTVSDARALRAQADAIGKPLLAVLLTHGHPDHYNGVTDLLSGEDVPVLATAAVEAVILADDEAKEALWTPVFGDEWPAVRTFPSQLVEDGETVTFDGVGFTVNDLGPGESHADSYWVLEAGERAAFVGDVAFHGVHSYLSDGHSGPWLSVLDRIEGDLAEIATIYPGHGSSSDAGLFEQQRAYVALYRQTVGELAPGQPALTVEAKVELEATMKAYLPTEALAFLIQLGADPVASELAQEE